MQRFDYWGWLKLPTGNFRTVAPATPLTITLRRNGEFAVNFSGSNTSQCGWLGQRVLHFDVKIVAAENALNSQGFIIDNNTVLEWFIQRYSIAGVGEFESCERIAAEAAKGLHSLVTMGGCEPDEVEVTISGGPQAELTARWHINTHGSRMSEVLASASATTFSHDDAEDWDDD